MSGLDASAFLLVLAAALAAAVRGRKPTIERFLGEPGESPWRVAAGLAAVDLSALTMISLPAYAFGLDLRGAWLVAGAALGRAACALFLVPAVYGKGATVYAPLEAAFGASARRAAGWVFGVSRVAAAGVRLAAAAAALAGLCGGSARAWAAAATGAAAALSLPRGLPGLLSAGAVQCAAVFAALAGAAGVCVWLADGGVASLWAMARQGERLAFFDAARPLWAGFWSRSDAPLGSLAAGALASAASFAGDHEGAQKWLAAPDEESASRATLGAAALAGLAAAGYLALGAALYGLYRLTPGFSQPDRAADVVAHFGATLLPAGLRGLFAAALLLSCSDLPGLSLAAGARADLGWGARSRRLWSVRGTSAAALALCLLWGLACLSSDWLARTSLVFSTIGFGALLGAVAAAAKTTASGESALLGFCGALALGVALGVACERGAVTLAWTWLGPLTALASFLLCGPLGFAHH